MKIHFIKDDALTALKTNIAANTNNYRKPTNEWIYDYFQGEKPFVEFKLEVEDFALVDSSDGDVGKTDVRNAITLYSAMKNISDTQATDERLWAGLCHGEFWDYVGKRWNAQNSCSLKQQDLLTHYFFGQDKKRSLITNTLSKLWWLGRLTYDQSRADPFELTHYFENDFSTKTLVIFSNNFMSNKNIATGLISALADLENENFSLHKGGKREIYYAATKYLNILGGTVILDMFSPDEIKTKVINHLKSLNE